MVLDQRKYEHKHEAILRDIRPFGKRVSDAMSQPTNAASVFILLAGAIYFIEWATTFADLLMIFALLYFWWLRSFDHALIFKLPMSAAKRGYKDKNNEGPGRSGKPEGILYVGNVDKSNEEVWFTNSDARTHVLYLGTTGSGKTVGLTSFVTNALTWGSGFVYVDGKADTDLWSNLSSLVRRFGRDDDLLILNYMTGNSDAKSPSNTMNPFSSGSASYLTQMLVSLMPASEGDNAMWKERAVSLVGAMMPALTYKRDHQDIPMSVRTIRDYLSLNNVVKLSRDQAVPEIIREGLIGYLDTLPGFVHSAYDDDGQIKPPDGSGPPPDTTTANQQHGYLAMQFTRSLQSLGDDYGYIFDTQAADVDMVDIVLNRRILIVLIPALEKSGDEIANLGKIVAATIKGMMGSTLGSTVEGSSETVIENKPTHSSTPFMTVFDEVGYYTAEGMAVMAAQARSLGFCLIFSGQDLPAMKKKVREEANSITANCNIKLFGKLEDPTETKEFFEKTVGQAIVTEVSGFQMTGGSEFGSYFDTQQAGVQVRARASYEGLRGFKEGEAIVTFGEAVTHCKIFYSNPGHAKAMRVTRFLALPPPDEATISNADVITTLRDKMVNKSWTAERADVAIEAPPEIEALVEGFREAEKLAETPVDAGIAALVKVLGLEQNLDELAGQGAVSAAATAKTPTAAKPDAAKPAAASPPSSPLAKKPGTAPASPLAKKPDAPTAPPQTATAAPPQRSGNANPMGFFGSGDKKAAGPPPSAPPEKPQAATAPQSASAPSKPGVPAEPPRKKLPPEIENIIKDAASDARTKLFGNKKEDTDAAE